LPNPKTNGIYSGTLRLLIQISSHPDRIGESVLGKTISIGSDLDASFFKNWYWALWLLLNNRSKGPLQDKLKISIICVELL